MNNLTDRQLEVLCFCWEYFLRNDNFPVLETIASELEYKSNNTAYEHLKALGRKSCIEPSANPNKYKFTQKSRDYLESITITFMKDA